VDHFSRGAGCALASSRDDGRNISANVHARFAAGIGSVACSRSETGRTENKRRDSASNSSNWKQISMLDVSSFLRSDSNTIEARVFNDDAPPAFWLALTTDSSTLRTDGKWESSLAGSSWRNCTPASVPRYPRPGNLLAGGEKIFNVFPKVWRAWIVFGILAIVLTIAAGRWLDRNKFEREWRHCSFLSAANYHSAWAMCSRVADSLLEQCENVAVSLRLRFERSRGLY
jgi:hypothetical protein